ncbi:hypothetical protein ACRQ5D_33875 [Mucilaginibacter sp. P25]|uniref:hypothetical protein n=1 Tax=Mucilaginibacter sp. P25 TaxID=3423945 RepID=UPI003D79B61F
MPKPRMIAELAEKGISAELATCDSPQWKHTEMYNRALAFKRELHYEFTQWKSKDDVEDPDVHGYLFTHGDGAIVGACAFRNRTCNPGEIRWGLQWIWICPRERRNGYLARRWKAFREKFSSFIVEAPVSEEMKAFLRKHGDDDLMRYDQ